MTTTTDGNIGTEPSPGEVEEFTTRFFGWLQGGAATLLINVAHRTGLLAAAVEGPGTSAELAARGGLSERHVRELLDGLTAIGVFTIDPDSRRYALPPAAAACLTGDGPSNFAPTTSYLPFMGGITPAVADTVRNGGGIGYEAYRPEFTELMDQGLRRVYDALLLPGYVPSVDGLHEKLSGGCRAADLGCGTGHVDNLLARAYPGSTFVGYDLADDALEQARTEAAGMGLDNVRFERMDVRQIPTEPPFDVVFAFDAIHDQADPAGVLARVHDALAPGGLFVMIDVYMSSNVEDNVGHPMAAQMYGASLFHCMQVSLAVGGAGLGTCWGWQKAVEMLEAAGFSDVAVVPAPGGDPMNAIFVGHR
jgi:SAM-dependent methyltransferase